MLLAVEFAISLRAGSFDDTKAPFSHVVWLSGANNTIVSDNVADTSCRRIKGHVLLMNFTALK